MTTGFIIVFTAIILQDDSFSSAVAVLHANTSTQHTVHRPARYDGQMQQPPPE